MSGYNTRSRDGYQNNQRNSDPITFDILDHIAVLSVNDSSNWKKEVNIVAWNGKAPKIDIREWSPDHDRMRKGVTLQDDEARKMAEALSDWYMLNGSGYHGGRNMQPVHTKGQGSNGPVMPGTEDGSGSRDHGTDGDGGSYNDGGEA